MLPVLAAAVWLSAGPAAGRLPAGHLLSASVGADAGYTSNRLGDPDGPGSGFVSTSPSLGYTGFLAGRWEIGARAGYWRREFLSAESSYEDEVSAGARALAARGSLQVSLAADAGRFRNGDDPLDDNRWVRLSPAAWWAGRDGRELGMRVRGVYREYDTLLTWSGEDEDALAWRLTPNAAWPCSPSVLLWADIYAEGSSSNEPEDEYDGFGGRVGLTWTPRPKWRFDASAGGGRRAYGGDGGDEDTWLAAGRARYRWNPWVALFSAADAETWTGRGGSEGGDEWQVRVGVEWSVERDL